MGSAVFNWPNTFRSSIKENNKYIENNIKTLLLLHIIRVSSVRSETKASFYWQTDAQCDETNHIHTRINQLWTLRRYQTKNNCSLRNCSPPSSLSNSHLYVVDWSLFQSTQINVPIILLYTFSAFQGRHQPSSQSWRWEWLSQLGSCKFCRWKWLSTWKLPAFTVSPTDAAWKQCITLETAYSSLSVSLAIL